jgi:putative protease
MSDVEVLGPAGSWESLQAAIKGGSHSVYLGVGGLNMRSHSAKNFSEDDLFEIVRICHEKAIKPYVTLNSLIYDGDLELMRHSCQRIKEANVAAVIASDPAVIQYARSIGLDVHISTQLNVGNLEAVRFWAQFSDVIVLARELSLEQIALICSAIKDERICGPSGSLVRIEVFVHGALCVSISGKCYMSLSQHAKSANRGECLQSCRRRYRVIDEETQQELVVDNKYIMSPKDLCTIGVLDQIIAAGVSVLKIEGRGRSPEYVYTVVKAYRQAVDSIREGSYCKEKIDQWIKALEAVYNRGFWHGGYYLGNHLGEWSGRHGSQATQRKRYVGKVVNYYAKNQVAEIKIESTQVHVGDSFYITGAATGILKGVVSALDQEGKIVIAESGMVVTIPVAEKVRRSDKLYVVEVRE